ncbi:MAG TPA: FAD-dependent monooxygenase [Hyphomicrobiales bacterium]|nr:FAD-dependent monooxygenase [Hyphomicrobiales bacterium]
MNVSRRGNPPRGDAGQVEQREGVILSSSDTAPIVIVGGGPVGMMLALNLDALGVRSILLNTELRPRWHPKGSSHNSRTMEHFRRLGLAGRIRALGLPRDYPTDVGYFTRWSAWELARLRMPSEREKAATVAAAAPTDQVVEPILRCNQMYVEAAVFEHLRTRRCVDIRFGWRCDDWHETADGVEVEVVEVETGQRRTLACAYLAGCDGGQSAIRRKLDIHYGGDSVERQAYLGGAMVASHVRAPELIPSIPHAQCWQYWTVNAHIRSNILTLNGVDEFLFMTQLRDSDDEPDEALIRQRLADSLGKEIGFDFVGHWTWTPGQALVADRFSAGRVHLCGDAVHLFTPTGGFGLNTGIDDAANLGWKLAAMVQGWGGPELLDSYERERRPIAFRNTGMAKNLTRNVGKVPVSPALEEDTPVGAAARAETGKALATFGEEYASIGIQLGVRYDGSPLTVGDGCVPPPDDPFRYVPSACPGGRAPHLWLRDRTSLFDHLGPGFTLLCFDAADAEAAAMRAAAERRGMPLKVVVVDHPEGRGLYERRLALVRPDQHVAWRGDALPDDCSRLLARVTGG